MAPNVLIVRFSSIGDLLLTTPLLRAIRVRHPDSRITFVVREDMADTVRNNPRIDRVVTFRRDTPLGPLGMELRSEPWTHRLDLHGSLRSRALRRLIGGRWTGYSKHRIRRTLLILSHGRMGGTIAPVADRYFAAARDLDVTPDGGPLEFFSTPEGEATAVEFLGQFHLGEQRPLVALAPGAAHFTKRWPRARWAALASELSADNDIVILGGKGDEKVATIMADAAHGHSASAAGRFSHDVNGALLRRASVLVAGDTGLLHLGTAVGIPVVGIYGPTVEAFGFFPYHARRSVAVQHDLSCRPCSSQGGDRCPLGHHNCLVEIQPAEVLAAIAAARRVS